MTTIDLLADHPRGTPEGASGPAPRPGELQPLFQSHVSARDRLGRAPAATHLAAVALHRGTETPLTVAIFGPAGSGKSLFLDQVLEAVAHRSANAAARGSRVVAVRIEAGNGGRAAAPLFAMRTLEALGVDHAATAEDAIHAGGDPREAAALAGERVNALRRALDGERRALEDLGARRARLAETVLFDDAGSRVDAFARSRRSTIEARLRAFGLPTADPVRSFKEIVWNASEASGHGSRLRLTLRSLWAFQGQRTLLTMSVLLLALGWAASLGAADPEVVAGWLAGVGDRFAFATEWARAHLDWLRPVSQGAVLFGGVALVANLVRALRFLAPVFTGASLLDGDLQGRKRDLDGLLAHQTRRVDRMAADVETANRSADEAERRNAGRRDGGISDHGATLAAGLFGAGRSPDDAAAAVFDALSRSMGGLGIPDAGAPTGLERIVFGIDGLERLAPAAVEDVLQAAHRLLDRPGFVTFVALERSHVAAALGEADPALAAARLDRMVQLSYDLGAETPDPAALAQSLLDPTGHTAVEAPVRQDEGPQPLDQPLRPFERALVTGLAPFAGTTPRAVKRFVNAYRVARADPRLGGDPHPATLAVLAWALALDGTGAGREMSGVEASLDAGGLAVASGSESGRAYAAACRALGGEPPADDARRGLGVARSYSRTG